MILTFGSTAILLLYFFAMGEHVACVTLYITKTYVTNGTLVYVLLSKNQIYYLSAAHGRTRRSDPTVEDCRCSLGRAMCP